MSISPPTVEISYRLRNCPFNRETWLHAKQIIKILISLHKSRLRVQKISEADRKESTTILKKKLIRSHI